MEWVNGNFFLQNVSEITCWIKKNNAKNLQLYTLIFSHIETIFVQFVSQTVKISKFLIAIKFCLQF